MTEKIVAAAVRIGQAICFCEQPGRHHSVMNEISMFLEDYGVQGFDAGIWGEQGFVTNLGRFVDPERRSEDRNCGWSNEIRMRRMSTGFVFR